MVPRVILFERGSEVFGAESNHVLLGRGSVFSSGAEAWLEAVTAELRLG